VENDQLNTQACSAVEDTRAMLLDYLAHCRAAVAQAMKAYAEFDDEDSALMAGRMMRTSIDLITALEGRKREFVYRIADDREPAAQGVVPPSPHPEFPKTKVV
jgi:hypothetical protein